MEWRSHFIATFFSVWQDRGLADPSRHVDRYEAFCADIRAPEGLIEPASDASGPLAPKTLREVYTFGAFFGRAVGQLLALPAAEIERRADWCGRFNLGISLFDYLSDEAGRAMDLLRQPPFDRLASGAGSTSASVRSGDPSSSPAEQFLSRLATDVIAELEAEVGPVTKRPRPDGLWRSLREMMQAETLMSVARLEANPDVAALLDAAMTKSAGPFRCMAEWMPLATARAGGSRERARALGAAIGNCYWLVDDARDLWEDLDAGRWNLFLLAAARTQPGLFADRFDLASEMRLSKILLTPGWARQIVTPMISQLQKALGRVTTAPTVCDEVTGLLGVSMERWLR